MSMKNQPQQSSLRTTSKSIKTNPWNKNKNKIKNNNSSNKSKQQKSSDIKHQDNDIDQWPDLKLGVKIDNQNTTNTPKKAKEVIVSSTKIKEIFESTPTVKTKSNQNNQNNQHNESENNANESQPSITLNQSTLTKDNDNKNNQSIDSNNIKTITNTNNNKINKNETNNNSKIELPINPMKNSKSISSNTSNASSSSINSDSINKPNSNNPNPTPNKSKTKTPKKRKRKKKTNNNNNKGISTQTDKSSNDINLNNNNDNNNDKEGASQNKQNTTTTTIVNSQSEIAQNGNHNNNNNLKSNANINTNPNTNDNHHSHEARKVGAKYNKGRGRHNNSNNNYYNNNQYYENNRNNNYRGHGRGRYASRYRGRGRGRGRGRERGRGGRGGRGGGNAPRHNRNYYNNDYSYNNNRNYWGNNQSMSGKPTYPFPYTSANSTTKNIDNEVNGNIDLNAEQKSDTTSTSTIPNNTTPTPNTNILNGNNLNNPYIAFNPYLIQQPQLLPLTSYVPPRIDLCIQQTSKPPNYPLEWPDEKDIPIGPYYCLKAACVANGKGSDDRTVGHIALIDWNLKTVANIFVKPKDKIVSYIEPITSLNEEILTKYGMDLEDAIKIIQTLLPPTAVIVGQNITMDINRLGLETGKHFKSIIDLRDLWRTWSSRWSSYTHYSLVHQAKCILDRVHRHSASEDGIITMKLFHYYIWCRFQNMGLFSDKLNILQNTTIEPSFAKKNPIFEGVDMQSRRYKGVPYITTKPKDIKKKDNEIITIDADIKTNE